MSLVSLEQKLSELRRCDKDGCGRWWRKTDFKLVADETDDIFYKCPHCRGAKPTPTKYWHGDLTGPREPSYEYPARMPRTSQTRPLPLNPSGDRQSSAKRQMSGSGDLLANTPTQNKKLKLYQQQATPASTPIASVAEIAKMVRKDSLGSTVSPTTAKAEPSNEILHSNVQRHYEEWKSCKGRPDEFMQKELRVAEENLESLQKNIPKIELAVKDTQQQHTEAQEELKRMEVFQEELDASAAKARLSQGRHKDIKDQWYMESRKHVQVAWEENNRCSKAWQKAVNDRAEAQRIEMEAKQKIE